MGLGDIFDFYAYSSDNGSPYVVKLSALVAAAGGFGSPVGAGSGPGWPYGPRNMRHVWGVDGDGHRTRLPIKAGSNTLFTTGGTFSLSGRTYTVQGQIGEARKANNIGG